MNFRLSRSEEEPFLRIHFLVNYFWTSLFGHQLHRGGHEESPLKDMKQDTVGGKGRCEMNNLSGVDSSYRHVRSEEAAKTIKNPGVSDHHPGSTAGDCPWALLLWHPLLLTSCPSDTEGWTKCRGHILCSVKP